MMINARTGDARTNSVECGVQSINGDTDLETGFTPLTLMGRQLIIGQ